MLMLGSGQREVNVWIFRAGIGARALPDVLSIEDRQRIDRYRLPRDRQLREVAWTGIRIALGLALGQPPHRLRFTRTCRHCGGSHGKPRLDGREADEFDFSLSHAGELAVVAIGHNRDVGVDVETIGPTFDWQEIRMALPTKSRDQVASLPKHKQAKGFLHEWVRLEAAAKVTGFGLREEVKQHTCSVQLSWLEFEPMPMYAAAVAASGMEPLSTPVLDGFALLEAAQHRDGSSSP